jgi:arylsulfatase A-like enzyme
MKRRNIVSLIIPLSLLVLITLFSFKKRDAEKNNELQANTKPNIIFLLTDDQRWDALGAMGNTIIKTPNMNKLASAGVLFQNAYATTSICCVSRASLLTGQYESRHHIHDFSTDLSPEAIANSYPVLLKKQDIILDLLASLV